MNWKKQIHWFLFCFLLFGGCALNQPVDPFGVDGPPYTPGIHTKGTLFVSGQLGTKKGKLVPGGITAETKQALNNLNRVLKEAGFSPTDVVKATVFLADIKDYKAMNKVYGQFFKKPYPARECVAVKELVLGAKVEISAIAVCR